MDAVAPTVSVVIPCYNQGQYLDEAVESVLAQTFQDFEMIIINDGSTEPETIEILKAFDRPKTKVIHTHNQGPSVARNTGIAQAQGQYILPLDADDKIGERYLEKAVEVLNQQENVGIVYCEAEYFGEKTGKCNFPEYRFPDILLGNVIFSTSLYRKSDWQTVGGYNANMIYGLEDYDLWLSIIALGREVVRLPDTLFFYRQTPDSRNTYATQQHLARCYAQAYRNHVELYSANIDVIFDHIVDLTKQVHRAGEHIHLTTEHLQQTQAQLHLTTEQLQQTQAQLHLTTEQLQQTQAQLQETQGALVRAQAQIHHTEDHVEEVRAYFQAELAKAQATVEQLSVGLEQVRNQNALITNSKFWKMRNLWIQFKQRIRLAEKE